MKVKIAQADVMGLAAIVIIIIAILIFAAGDYMKNDGLSYKQEFTREQLAYGVMNSFLKTTSRDCGKLSMSQLLQDCSGTSQKISCGVLDSCSYVYQEAKEIFSSTLDEWRVGYGFKAFNDNKSIISIGKGCSLNKKSRQFPIAAEEGILMVQMDIC